MKLNKLFLSFGLIAAMGLTACSDDVPVNEGNGTGSGMDTDGDFYATVSLSLPTPNGSRAATEGDVTANGYEVGQDGENQISNVRVILASKTPDGPNAGKYTAITYALVTDPVNLSNTSGRPTYALKFKGQDIRSYLEAEGNSPDVTIFVYCNSNDDISMHEFSFSGRLFSNPHYKGYSDNQRILMSGKPLDITLPSVKELLLHDSPTNPYLLTGGFAIPVERGLARFDFKDNTTASVFRDENNQPVPNTFDIKSGDKIYGQIQITHMGIVNDANSAYIWGRTSSNGYLNKAGEGESPNYDHFNFKLVSREIGTTDYVVSPIVKTFTNKFTGDPAKDIPANDWQEIAALNLDDNDQGWTPGTGASKEGYKIWRYVGENTIPYMKGSGNEENKGQIVDITTTVYFKGNILNYSEDGQGIPGYGTGDLYLFQHTLHGDFSAFANAALDEDEKNPAVGYINPDMAKAFNATWEEKEGGKFVRTIVTKLVDAEGVETGETKTETKTYDYKEGVTSPAKELITVYSLVDGKYPVFYAYRNRHNDNSQANKMGPMEFGVVRNNVYKLYINSINRFGHPNDPKLDPTPDQPGDPDEKEDIYIQMSVEVLPWTVRVNNIDF